MKNKKTVQITCDVKDTFPLDNLTEFQGDLKSLTEENYRKLKNEIIETGFAFPVFVWLSDEVFVIGGHQRVKTLKRMRDEGWIIPEVPVVVVKAKDLKEAKRRVLQDVSQYGKIESEGLNRFILDSETPFDSLLEKFDLPNINLKEFLVEYQPEAAEESGIVRNPQDEWVGMPEFNQNDKTSFRHVIVHFKCQEDVDDFFRRIEQNDTGKTKSIWFPEQENMDTEAKRY